MFFYLSPYKSKSEIEFWRNEVHANTTVEKGLQEAPELTFFTSLERVADILSKWSTQNTLKSTPKAYLYMLRPNTDAVLKTNHFECGEKISSVRVLDAPRLLKFLFKESPSYIALNASMFLPVPGSLVIESLFTPSSRSIQNDRVKAQVKFLHQKSTNSDACTAMLLGFIENVNPSYHSMMNSDPKKDLGVVFSHEFGALTVFYLGNDNSMEFCGELSALNAPMHEGKLTFIMVHNASFSKFCNLFKFQKVPNSTVEFEQLDDGKMWLMEPKEDGFWMRFTIIESLKTSSLTGKPVLHLSDLMASSGVTKLHNATVSKPLRHQKNHHSHNHGGLILDLELYEPDVQSLLMIIPDEIEHHNHGGAQRPILRIPDLLH